MGKLQLGVIYGSRSSEHEVSVISALQLMKAVDRQKYDVIPVYISMKGEWFTGEPLWDIRTYANFDPALKGLVKVQLDVTTGSGALTTIEPPRGLFGHEQVRLVARLGCVIPVLHGMHGEDGTLQGMLEMCNIPYASSGVAPSAVGMDKVFLKQYFQGGGFPVLPGCRMLRTEWESAPESAMEAVEKALPYPVFVKPASLGSSIGVSKASNRQELIGALSLAFQFDRKVLIEKGLEKPLELNCSVLGYGGEARASEIEMPVTGGDLLSFMDKYLQGSSSAKGMASLKRVLPAPIEPELRERIRTLSVDIFKNMDCKGVVRIDYMYDTASGELYITEINTIPGSLAFYLWEPCQLPYARLIDEMVACALKAHEEKNDSNYAFTSDILSNLEHNGKNGAKLGAKMS
ncbi:MAG: D-alanine--D-alanine ligase [Eubacteriales bacterium]|nr:D-alanine--D-alanine ligase [Eubacteriales bacterium]